MSDLGTFQIRFPDFEISYPEPQFRADARPLFDQLRAKFLAGMADVYDRYAEKARQRYNEIDPATERPPVMNGGTVIVGTFASGGNGSGASKRKLDKKRAAKPAARRKRK